MERYNKNLYDWVFRFNPYEGKWYGTKRDNYHELFNDKSSDKVLRSSDIGTLISIIRKTDGNINKIKKLISG